MIVLGLPQRFEQMDDGMQCLEHSVHRGQDILTPLELPAEREMSWRTDGYCPAQSHVT